MGLKLTLNANDSYLAYEFKDAYWKVDEIQYSTTAIGFRLVCYPSREASKKHNMKMDKPSLPFGGPVREFYDTELYRWYAQFAITDVFPNGIPLNENEQKTAIYEFVKAYTQLPFENVFEEDLIS